MTSSFRPKEQYRPGGASYRSIADAWRDGGRHRFFFFARDREFARITEFDAREGGRFRISLTYDEPTGTGKTTAHTDTYHGRFAKLVPNEKVVEVVEFETDDPALRGEMTITITLTDADGGTDLLAVHDGLPSGLSSADNEAGWREALEKLAALVEAGY